MKRTAYSICYVADVSYLWEKIKYTTSCSETLHGISKC